MNRSVLAIAAHPDDIEFVMAGTLLRLAQRGWEVHYFNVANGCCGSKTLGRRECAEVRLEEARRAASLIPARFYPPICNDMEVFYDQSLLAKVNSVVRQARPSIVLTHSLADYMEDHQNAARLAVGAAFTRSMPNMTADPEASTYDDDVALYHAQPHGNRDSLGNLVHPTHFVDVGEFMDRKRELLSAHASQDQWLESTQRISAYLETMVQFNAEVGSLSQQAARQKDHVPYQFAEGWRQHFHLGFSQSGFDPLAHALSECVIKVH